MNFAKRRFGARGSALVEFTLVLPLLVALFLGAVFFGQDIHMYNRLEESVRAGARFASMATYDAYSGADPTPTCTGCQFPVPGDPGTGGPFVTRVKNIVACGDPAGGSATGTGCTDTTVVERVGPDKVDVSLNIVSGVPVSVKVSISRVPMVTPVGSLVLTGKPNATFPFVGVYMHP